LNHEFHELHETNGWTSLPKNGARVSRGVLDIAKSPLTYGIIGSLLEVHADMGPGYLERSYQEAVELALGERSIAFEREAAIPVRFKHHILRTVYRADFVCGGQVLLELKAQDSVGPVEHAQIIHYLKASGLPVGLLANFGEESLVVRRFVGASYRTEAPI
jgi:GxxExxY protein